MHKFVRKSAFICLLVPMVLLIGSVAVEGQQTEQKIEWISMKKAQDLARQNNKKVLIFAEAQWCTYCRKMDREVFPEQTIIDTINKYYYAVRVDIESDNAIEFNGQKMTESQFGYRYRVRSTPTTFFVKPDGEIIGGQPGFLPADIFDQLLVYIGSDAYQSLEFKDYLEESDSGK